MALTGKHCGNAGMISLFMIDLQYVFLCKFSPLMIEKLKTCVCLVVFLRQKMPNVPSMGLFTDLTKTNAHRKMNKKYMEHMGTIFVSIYIQFDPNANIIVCQLLSQYVVG
jgi:hypothetical protein